MTMYTGINNLIILSIYILTILIFLSCGKEEFYLLHDGDLLNMRLSFGKLTHLRRLLVSMRILILLVLTDQVVQVGLGLSELHLVHPFACVPMQERFSAEHSGELIGDSFEEILDRCGVADESRRKRCVLKRNVTNGSLDVVRNPVNKEIGVLCLHFKHLVIDFLRRDFATENHRRGEITTSARVKGGHHVLRVEYLLCQIRHCDRSILLRISGEQRCISHGKKVQTWERNKVHCNLAEIGIKLSGESKGACDSTHDLANETIEVSGSRSRQLEGLEADIVQGFIVDAKHLISVLNELVEGQSGVIWLNDGVGDFGRRND